MKIGWRNQSSRCEPATVPLCPPETPHDLNLGLNMGRCVGKPANNRPSGLVTGAGETYEKLDSNIGPGKGCLD